MDKYKNMTGSGLPWEGYYYSAYGIAVKHGYKGTEEEWLASLKGDKGNTGATGAKLVSQVRTGVDQYGNYVYTQTFDDGTTATLISPKGNQGDTGDAGKSAYASALDGGYTGTEQEFNAALSGVGDLEAVVQAIEGKIPSGASSTNKLVSASEMGDAIEAVEAKQLYATNVQGSFATKAALTAATTFYNADGTVATPTKNDVAYVLADESHSGKSAKYVIASVDPVVWGFVITFSDTTFTQAQMDAINSGVTSTKRAGYDSHVSNSDIHVTAAQKQAWTAKQDALPAAVLNRFLHTNASTGNLEWAAMPKEIALYDHNSIPGGNAIYDDLQDGKIPVYVYNTAPPERGIYICCGGEYEDDDFCYYFMRLAGTTMRYFKQKNVLGGQWSGYGSYEIATQSALSGKQDKATTQTVTISVSDWAGGTSCVKNVQGVTDSSIIICESSDNSVQCAAQGAGTLAFSAGSTPTEAVAVKVVILP